MYPLMLSIKESFIKESLGNIFANVFLVSINKSFNNLEDDCSSLGKAFNDLWFLKYSNTSSKYLSCEAGEVNLVSYIFLEAFAKS